MGDLPSLVPMGLLKYISAYLLHHNLHTFPHSQTTSGFRINLNSQYGIIRKNYCCHWELEPSPHQRIMLEVLILPEETRTALSSQASSTRSETVRMPTHRHDGSPSMT